MAGSTSYSALLPHCRYQAPAWLSDTLARLLDDYERAGCSALFPAGYAGDRRAQQYGRAHIYDSDNKGWKAVSNALKGRLFPDDDQYTLALSLLSTRSTENVCHITLLDLADAAIFRCSTGDYRDGDFYSAGGPLTDTRPISLKTPFARG
ncbi:MAG: hypothetical protein ACLVKN_20050 [Flavonifractor plautii]